MSKSTPWPWSLEAPHAKDRSYILVSASDETLGQIWEPLNKAEHDANARLIAAAPELLDELTEARTTLSILRTQVMVELNRGIERWEGVPEKLKERLDTIGAATAKARGAA